MSEQLSKPLQGLEDATTQYTQARVDAGFAEAKALQQPLWHEDGADHAAAGSSGTLVRHRKPTQGSPASTDARVVERVRHYPAGRRDDQAPVISVDYKTSVRSRGGYGSARDIIMAEVTVDRQAPHPKTGEMEQGAVTKLTGDRAQKAAAILLGRATKKAQKAARSIEYSKIPIR